MSEEDIVQEEEKKQKQDKFERRPQIPNLPPDRPGLNIVQMRELCGNFAKKVFGNPDVADKVKASQLVIRFLYYDELWGDEEVWVTINCRVEPVDINVGPSDLEPDVAMKMHADLAHKFWVQKLNLTMSIARGWVFVRGAIPKLMRLIPFIRPGYALYKVTLAEMGFTALLAYPPDKRVAAQQEEAGQPVEQPAETPPETPPAS
jgi:hypothetical protein